MITTAPGGQDGREPTDKGGRLLLATYERTDAEKFIGKEGRPGKT